MSTAVKSRRPRTNAEAADHWAEGIKSHSPSYSITVNSVICEGDKIYSFGRHFPMGIIVRNAKGRPTRVVLNSDHYPSRGFGNTPRDQWNVKAAANAAASEARWNVEVVEMKLSDYSGGGMRLRPMLNDIEPDPWPSIEIPTFFYAPNPGPEPTDDGVGCIAGQREEYSYAYEATIWPDASYGAKPKPGDHVVRHNVNATTVERAANGVIEWTDASRWYGYNDPQSETKVCPHCKAFKQAHEKWRTGMHGGYIEVPRHRSGWGTSTRKYVRGYKEYRELWDRFGGEQGWRDARRNDYRRVRRLKKLRAEWVERNFVGLNIVPRDAHGIPKLDKDGYVRRSHVEQARRAAVKAARQREIARKEQVKRQEAERREAAKLYAEQRARIAEARVAWDAGVSFPVRDEVADWCAHHGVSPNEDQTVTLVKAVRAGSFASRHGGIYEVGTTVVADDYNPTASCGYGLHFGPTEQVAEMYHRMGGYRDDDPVFLNCRVPLATLVPLNDKCKAQSCYVEGVRS